jgi:hypothetical protein
MERCSACGRDCSFISGMERLCLPCFDTIQSLGTAELTRRLVLAVREIERLKSRNPGDWKTCPHCQDTFRGEAVNQAKSERTFPYCSHTCKAQAGK